jgi:hypothetical protein
LCFLRNDFGVFSPLLGDKTVALHSLRNDFGAFSPLLGDKIVALHSLKNDFRAFLPLLGDKTLALHSLRNDLGGFSPLLGDKTLALYPLRNDFEPFSPLLGDKTLALHSLRNDFEAFSPLLGDKTLALHSLRNNFGAFHHYLVIKLTFVLGSWKLNPLFILIFYTRGYYFGIIAFLGKCTFIDLRYPLYKYYIFSPVKKPYLLYKEKGVEAWHQMWYLRSSSAFHDLGMSFPSMSFNLYEPSLFEAKTRKGPSHFTCNFPVVFGLATLRRKRWHGAMLLSFTFLSLHLMVSA